MRKLLLASSVAAALGAGDVISAAPPVPGDSHFALGVVQQVHRAGGAVTLLHEPVESLKWPAMKMEFTVARPELLDRLSEGRQVAIEFVSENGSYRIVNAIPLAQAGSAAAVPQQGMHDGMKDMAGMKEMCAGMMGGMHGGKRWWQFWK